MDAGGKIALSSDTELGDKHILLSFVIEPFLPTVEANLTDGSGMSVEHSVQFCFPIVRALVDAPWMIAEAGEHLPMCLRQRGYGRPILFGTTVNHHARHLWAFSQQFGLPATKALGLQVVVRVKKHLLWGEHLD